MKVLTIFGFVSLLPVPHKQLAAKDTAQERIKKRFRSGCAVVMPLIILLGLYFFYLKQAYYFGIDHTYIVLRAGTHQFPFLPGFGRVVIQTDFKQEDLANDRCEDFDQGKLSGFWFLHGKEGYELWGDQLAHCLKSDIQTKWLRWLRRPAYNMDILSRSFIGSENSIVTSNEVSDLEQLARMKPEFFTPEIVQSLTVLLSDKNINVRSGAASILRKLAVTNPKSFTPEIIQSLADLLIKQDYMMHSEQTILILGSLAQSKPEVSRSLAGLLDEKDSDVRYRAAFALEQLARIDPTSFPVKIVPSLLALLTDKDGSIRATGVSALGQIAQMRSEFFTPEIVHSLTTLLGDEDYHVRASVASALGGLVRTRPEFFTPETVRSLTTLLADHEPFVRSNAAFTLGQLAEAKPEYFTGETLRTLMALLKDGGSFVPCSAAFALSKLAQTKPELFTPEIVQSLSARLADEDLGLRSNVASALGELAQRNPGAFTPDIVQGLIALLGNGDSAVQSGAASVLGMLAQEKPEFIQSLFHLLENDKSSIARNGASEALFVADVKDTYQKDFIEAELGELIRSPQPYLRAAASQTLEMIVVGGLIQDAHAHPDQHALIRSRLNVLKSLDESLHEEHLQFAAQTVLDEIGKIRSANK